MNIERLKLILDPVAEAIYERIFDEPLGPSGTIERALYRDAAEAGLRAALGAYAIADRSPKGGDKGTLGSVEDESGGGEANRPNSTTMNTLIKPKKADG